MFSNIREKLISMKIIKGVIKRLVSTWGGDMMYIEARKKCFLGFHRRLGHFHIGQPHYFVEEQHVKVYKRRGEIEMVENDE